MLVLIHFMLKMEMVLLNVAYVLVYIYAELPSNPKHSSFGALHFCLVFARVFFLYVAILPCSPNTSFLS